jgi:two-component system sensor histidine kinase GlrK
MRIATRVAVGTGLVLLLVASALALQTLAVARLATAQRDLGETRLPATALAADLAVERDRIEEYLRKHAVTGDPAYANAVQHWSAAFASTLARLMALQARGGEIGELQGLQLRWRVLPLADRQAGVAAQVSRMSRAEQLALAGDPLRRLEEQIAAISEAVRADATRHVELASLASRRATRVSVVVLLAAVVVGAVVSLVTVRSINRPLGRLVEATREVSRGAFHHRVRTAPGTELAVLADHFNLMTSRLAELDRLKRDFLSHVSHEIKTPLVAMEETTQLLLEEVPGPLQDRQRRLLELHLDGHRRLRRMISDLLDLARMEAGVLDYAFAPGDLTATVRDAAEALAGTARSRDVEVLLEATDPPGEMFFDHDRVVQVVQNLLANAIRFSPEGGRVDIRVRGDANGARIEVADSGPGVPASERERVFERFHQVPGTVDGSRTSVGLGLAICREIVEAHGGSIHVRDALAGGACFVVELPTRGLGGERSRRELEQEERV